jgi:aminoglycoside/choline kinase family phosphotransferase
MDLPKNSAEISVDWLNDALAGSGVTGGAAISGFEREVIGEGAGFVGELSRFTLQYDGQANGAPRTVIAKLPTADEAVRNMAQLFGFYEREVRFYEEIAGQVKLRTPRRLFSAMDPAAGRYVLLLEDLAPGRCGDQLASCSLDEARLALREIAKFHAAWWNNPRLDEFPWLPALDEPLLRQVLQAIYRQSWPFFEETLRDRLPAAIFDIGRRFGESFEALAERWAGRPRTIVHTDFRLDNMFFALADGSPFALIDWQIAQRGLGPGDIAYFLAGNFPPDVRRQHEQALLQTYHETLRASGVTNYDFEQCWEEYRMSMLTLFILLVTNRENVDIAAYGERAQTLIDTMIDRYTTAIVDLNAAEFLP